MPAYEDVLAVMVQMLAAPDGVQRFRNYGYDVWLPDVAAAYLQTTTGGAVWGDSAHVQTTRSVYEAAWQLSRRGILRPGVRELQAQVSGDGEGYCFTEYGLQWLAAHAGAQILPIEPRRFLQLIREFGPRFEQGFLARATEAVGCYEAGLHLAACAMCGAAAESVLLSLATELRDEDEALHLYTGRDGRRKVEDVVLTGRSEHVRRTFHAFMDLLKYWRDEAAHGRPSEISDDEAFTSLMLVARLGRFALDTFSRENEP